MLLIFKNDASDIVPAPDYMFESKHFCSSSFNGDLMCNNTGSCLIGYIYKNLFHDTERCSVIGKLLSMWEDDKENFISKLNGSFAFCLNNTQSGDTLVSTDRFSTYPLWYCNLEYGSMAISTNFHSLANLIDVTIDYATLWSYLTRSRPVSQRSFYNEIRAIKPGTALLFKKGKLVEEKQWYKPIFKPEQHRSLKYWGGELVDCLDAAMSDQLKGAKQPGLLLSGGLDSRLLASIAPKNTLCFTLADFHNREMKTASKVADICGLKHIPIIRSKDWYPSLLEYSIQNSLCLWHWHHMHFKPLQEFQGQWQTVDRVMLGMGFDTLFKGNQVANPVLWDNLQAPLNSQDTIDRIIDYGTRKLPIETYYERIMHPEVIQACRRAYREALLEEIKQVLPMATCVPDVWEMVQFRSIHRVPYFTNLTCLQGFIESRNVVFDNRVYDLYFRIPANFRRTGDVVRKALQIKNRRLATIIDGNSWLPTYFPSHIHNKARYVRKALSAIRNKWYRMSGSRSFKSHGSWPQIGRLWIHDTKMHSMLNGCITDLNITGKLFFNEDYLRNLWNDYKTGNINCPEVIDALGGLLLWKVEK